MYSQFIIHKGEKIQTCSFEPLIYNDTNVSLLNDLAEQFDLKKLDKSSNNILYKHKSPYGLILTNFYDAYGNYLNTGVSFIVNCRDFRKKIDYDLLIEQFKIFSNLKKTILCLNQFLKENLDEEI